MQLSKNINSIFIFTSFNLFLTSLLLLISLSVAQAQDGWKTIVGDEPTKNFKGQNSPKQAVSQGAIVITANPEKVEPGDRVTITVTVPDAIRHDVGYIDIIRPDGTFPASSSGNNTYQSFWKVPRNLKGSIKITCTVFSKTVDPFGQKKIIGTGETQIKVTKLVLSLRSEGVNHNIKKPHRLEAVIHGGTSPYTCIWFLGGPSKVGIVEDYGTEARSVQVVNWKRTGTHRIGVTFTDADGFTKTAEGTVRVQGLALGMSVSCKKVTTKENVNVLLNASGGLEPYAFAIGCGGKGPVPTISTLGMATAKAICSYSKPGQYWLRASVSDADGNTDSQTVGIRVLGGFIVLQSWGPHKEGETVELIVTIEDLISPYNLNVTWGSDGSKKIPGLSKSVHILKHVFKKKGKYDLVVTVKDSKHEWASASQTIMVEEKTKPCKCRSDEVICSSGCLCCPKGFPCWSHQALQQAIRTGKCRYNKDSNPVPVED